MAIDTAAKRASAARFGRPWASVLLAPAGAVDQAARQAVVWLYSGVLAGAPVDEFSYGNNDVWLVPARNRVAVVPGSWSQ